MLQLSTAPPGVPRCRHHRQTMLHCWGPWEAHHPLMVEMVFFRHPSGGVYGFGNPEPNNKFCLGFGDRFEHSLRGAELG